MLLLVEGSSDYDSNAESSSEDKDDSDTALPVVVLVGVGVLVVIIAFACFYVGKKRSAASKPPATPGAPAGPATQQ